MCIVVKHCRKAPKWEKAGFAPGVLPPSASECRLSMTRTVSTVKRAIKTVNSLYPGFGVQVPLFKASTCSELAKEVKTLLASEADKIQEDVAHESVVMTFQSIKKLLPSSCKCQEKGLLLQLRERLTKAPRRLEKKYLHFVRKYMGKMFPKGWDLGLYGNRCYTSNPNLSASADCKRSAGGLVGVWGEKGQVSFLDGVLRGEIGTPSIRAKALLVQSAGKPRPLTSFESDSYLLEPLHKTIYDYLSRRKWLLRGEVTARALDGAGFVEGEKLVSGDYAADRKSVV